ncbi:hypothetical protein Enr10x_50530 [Gimesia panareensis]|uniref:Lipoprotein n=1 Tax=Gimesia panareensis TaxID=2527978 RepID=A0A517QDJ6_9PLAN|nr:hypothetical protein [Gimesia panareensis]QDT29698.1 hypothetical protein Enr10x_50530 [Gimesia panareensis]
MPHRFTLALVLFLCGGLLLSGCGYPEVSPKTYEISKALYSVCNQKSQERLEAVEELIQSSLEQEEISEREAEWLGEIIRQARQGEWEAALRETRQIMEDQVGR